MASKFSKAALAAVLALMSLAGCKPASRTPVSADDVEHIQDALGMQKAMDVTAERAMRDLSNIATPAQRTCIQGKFLELVNPTLDDQTKQLFETHENIEAWLAFGHTAAGGRILSTFRDDIMANARGETPPGLEQALNSLTAGEKEQVEDFLKTDAGRVIQKGWPSLDAALSNVQSQARPIATACGLLS